MTDLAALLSVQELDTSIDRLDHRLNGLPERAAVTRAETSLAALVTQREPLESRRDELVRSQKRVEDEVAQLDTKASAEEARLYSGEVTAARDLQDIQDEVTSLRRRQSDLETEVLEIMDLTEPVDAELARLGELRLALEAELATAREVLEAAEAEIRDELVDVRAQRAAAAGSVDPALLRQYEALRPQLGGTAVARIQGGTCGACHLGLSAVDVERIRRLPEGEVPSCPECGALLVR